MLKSQIYFGDCLDFIKELPDDSIDVCLTDPPYGIDFQSNGRKTKMNKIENDEVPFIDWIKPLFPKMKDGGRLLCFYRWDVQDNFLNEILEAGFIVK
jgi:site-specific DNA-methyltransferase (adenine-specific)